MSNIKQIFHHIYKRVIIKKLTDVKIHGGSGDSFSRIKNKDPALKNRWMFRCDYLGIRSIFVV